MFNRAPVPLTIALLALNALACTQQEFLFLTRPGQGTTGSKEESEAYYAAMDSPPEPTLSEWLKSRCFDSATELSAFYYNETDLGLGREMRCAECTSGPRTGLISCSVSNHGVPQGLDLVQFGRARPASIAKALGDLEDFVSGRRTVRGATVTMDFDPKRTSDKVRFYIYDASDPQLFALDSKGSESLIPGLQLDGEGGTFNSGVKYMRNCLSCHGGRFDSETQRIVGSTFLDFDLSFLVFANDDLNSYAPRIDIAAASHTTRSARNLDQLRGMNALVRKVAAAVGAAEIVRRIDGSYDQPVEQATAVYHSGYVPTGWPDTQVVRQFEGRPVSAHEFYDVAVHRYCAMCHFSQTSNNNLSQVDPNRPLTMGSFEQWFSNTNNRDDQDGLRLIHRDVCGSSDMPHAEVTRLNLLRDARALAYICN